MNKKIVRVLAVLLSAAVVSNIGTVTLEAEEVPEAKENEQVLEEDYEALETNGWYGDIAGGDRRYLDEKGQKLTGLQVIEGKTYYFNADGFLQTGWQQVNNKEYFFSYENGERYENRTENIDGIVFTFDRSGEYEKKDENIEVQEAENVTNQETTEESDGSPNKVLYNNEDDSQDEKNAILTGWKDTEDGRKYIGNNGDFVTGMQSIDGKLYYFNNEGILQYNWIVLGDNKYFALAEGSICIGWLKFGDIYYYCGSDGAIVKGLQKVGGKWYYFDDSGVRQTGWIDTGGKRYFGMPDGALHTGWLSFGSTYYYCGSGGEIVRNRPYTVNGVCYYFDKDGKRTEALSGWQEHDGKKYFGMPDGTYRIGWLSFGSTYYYCGSDGAIVKGLQKVGEQWYYFDGSGIRQTGWIDTEGKRYFGMPDGALHTGWLSFGSTYYYCGSGGEIVRNRPYTVNGVCYYFDKDGKRTEALSGWQEHDGKKYFGMPDGTYRIGWLSFGSTYYYCGSDGALVKGLQKIGGKWYYFDDSGIRQTGWIDTGGKRYFGMPDGALHTGWLSFGSTYYYCGNGGEIVRNRPYTVNGVCYYFDKDGKRTKALSGWQEHDGKKYFGMPDGTYRIGWLSFGSTYYYCGSDGAIVKGLQKIGGKWYYFNDSGIRQTGWIVTDGKRYFGMPDGALHTGWLSFGSTYYFCNSYAEVVTGDYPINGVLFTFDKNGIMQKKSGWGFYNGKRYFFNPNTGFPYMNQWVTFGQTRYFADRYGIMVSGWQRLWGNYYYFYPNTNVMARNTVIDGYTIGSDGVRVPTALGKMTARAWGYTSLTNYLLMVDRASHKVGVYRGSSGNWSNIHFWDCGDGAAATPTVSGVFKVGMKGYYFDSGSARCFWYTQFYGNYLFHSVLCYKDGSIMDGRVGMALSHGCVRLQIANAKWIYDNIPRGTTVVVY